MSVQQQKLMVVEDDSLVAMNIAYQSRKIGFNVVSVVNSDMDALQDVEQYRPDIVLMDINLGAGGNGIDTAEKILQTFDIPVVFLTAYSDDETVQRAYSASPYGYILKPFEAETLKATLMLALRRHALDAAVESHQTFIPDEELARTTLEINDDGVILLESTNAFNQLIAGKQRIAWEDFLKVFSNLSVDDILHELDNDGVFQTVVRVTDHVDPRRPVLRYTVVFSKCQVDGEFVEIGAIQDISKQESEHQHTLLSDVILNQLSEGVLILDHQNRVQRFNRAALNILGIEQDEALGTPLEDFFTMGRKRDQGLLSGEYKDIIRKELRVKNKLGQIDCLLSVNALQEPTEEHAFVAIVSDITQLKNNERKLADMAFRDSLTGVGNRNYLTHKLKMAEELGTRVSLIFIDLDGFKAINDNHGHDLGDQLLVDVTSRLNRFMRSSDSLVRFGGDEFVVVNVEDENSDSERLARRLLESFEEPFLIDDTMVSVSASIGIAKSDPAFSYGELLRHADIAMFNAKKRGKNTVACYNAEFKKEVEYRLYVEQGLRESLENGSVIPYFQPIVDIDGRLVSFEALARWLSPDGGVVSPDKFIPIAEQTQLIHELGLKMFRESCIALRSIAEEFGAQYSMHINVSTMQLFRSSIVDQFKTLCEQAKLEPRQIIIEVTESTIQNDASRVQLQRLRDLGFIVAIDDFGSGFSSFKELKLFPYDVVKLDKSMLDADGGRMRTKLLLEHLVNMFNAIDTAVLAEGVETDDDYAFCKDIKCQYLQGHLFNEPMNLSDLVSYITRKHEPVESDLGLS